MLRNFQFINFSKKTFNRVGIYMKDKNPQSFPGRTQTQINRAVKNAWKNWSTKINTGRGFPNHLFRGQQVYRATELIKKIQRLSSSNLLTPSNDPDEDEQLDDPVLDVGEVAQNRSMSIAEARESGRSRREASLVETRRRNESMTVFNEHLTGTRLVY